MPVSADRGGVHDGLVARNRWTYLALVTEVYDGDTITCQLDLGVRVRIEQILRLLGVDTPELRGADRAAGRVVRDHVRSLIDGRWVLVRTHKDDATGKFGRLLAEVFCPVEAGGPIVNLNQYLLESLRAVRPGYASGVVFTDPGAVYDLGSAPGS